MCLGSRREPPLVLGVPAHWSLGGSPAMPSTLRLGVERRRQTLYGGRGDPLSFVGKLLSEKRNQGDRDCVHGRDLIRGSNTLCECFNNVDVGVPLWLTKPRDKSSCQRVCFLSSLFKLPHLFIAIFVCLYFHKVES